ncbi:Ubiquitin domain containing protein [Parasponia andersonii]|uniref:Ubiquitin domain containing protein n=1 Tax=Parasponia andersonii TaxID=3476 RepID=A0A2P5AVC5_PARAD|nr:Ubiquitin domain containing protein [Parasponia andersonii]
MKLRLRPLDSKETLRIEVPNGASLHQLKEAIAQKIQSSSSSLRLSLNRSDELFASSPHDDSLQSLGIAAGDLIFYSIVPSQTLASNSQPSVQMEPGIDLGRGHLESPVSQNQETLVSNLDTLANESGSARDLVPGVGSNLEVGEGEEGFAEGSMEIDDDDGGESMGFFGSKFPESCFIRRLRRVLNEGLGEDGRDHKLMVIGVHSVFLESGFVGFDSVSGTPVDGFRRLLDNWRSSMAFTLSFRYTLPEILSSEGSTTSYVIETVVLKFQIMGRFVNVFGSLASGGSGTHRVCLDKHKFVPSISSVSSNGDSEREVYEFWKTVKDGLALPLLIDLCAKAGLPSPPCFMRLPSELQLKILECLPGNDIARMGCVCKELQYLSCNGDLWKKKFEEEFGSKAGSHVPSHWKKKFATYWLSMRQREVTATARLRRFPRDGWPLFNPIRRDPNPFELPHIGGDYDRLPGLVPPPFGRPGRLPLFRRRIPTNCNFGGSSG